METLDWHDEPDLVVIRTLEALSALHNCMAGKVRGFRG